MHHKDDFSDDFEDIMMKYFRIKLIKLITENMKVKSNRRNSIRKQKNFFIYEEILSITWFKQKNLDI